MADRSEKILLQIELDVNQTIDNLEKAKKALADFKAEQEQLNKSLADLKAAGQEGTASFTNLERQLIANKAAQQNTTVSIREYEKALRNAVAANDAGTGSINQLKSQLSLLTAEWSQLQATNRENTDEGKNVATAIDLTTQKLKEQEEAIGNARRNVGNYKEGFKSWRTELLESRNEAKRIIESFGSQSAEAVKATQKVADLTERYQVFQRTTQALTTGGELELIGKVASGLAGGFAAAQGAAALFGNENEAVNKAILKVQASIALLEGLKAFSRLGKDIEALLPILGFTKTSIQQTAIANQELAVAEGEAAIGARATGVAINSMLGPIGLVLLAATAISAAFDAFGNDSKEKIEALTEKIKEESNAHKEVLDTIKIKAKVEETELQNALDAAQEKKLSALDIASLEKQLADSKLKSLDDETTQNKKHLDELQKQHNDSVDAAFGKLTDEERQKEIDRNASILKEIEDTKNRNKEITAEQSKLHASIKLIDDKAADAQLQEQNKLSQEKIGIIRDDQQRELAAIREAGNEKLAAIKDGEANAAEQRILIAQDTALKIKQANLKFDLQELQERNKAAIAITKDGSDERLIAQINAARTEGEASLALIIGNGKVAEAKRLALQAETNQKLVDLEQQRIDRINALEQQNADNLISILNEQSNLFLEAKFAQLAAQERAEIDAAEKNGQDITLIEFKFNKLRSDAQNQFDDARLAAEQNLQAKLIQAKLVNTPQGSDEETALLLEKENNAFEQETALIKKHQQEKLDDAFAAFQTQFALAGDNQAQQLQAEQDFDTARKQINDNANADIEVANQNHIKNVSDITLKGFNDTIQQAFDAVNVFQQIEQNLIDAEANSEAERLQNLQDSGDARKQELQNQLDAFREAHGPALTAEQLQEKKYSDAIKAIDKDLAAERTASAKKVADERKALQKQAAVADFILSTAKIVVNTEEAVAKSVAASPLTFGQPFAGFAIIQGVVEEAIVATQLAKVLSLQEGGYTGDGRPSDVSTALGIKPYVYHKQEYVIPDPVLKMPAVKSFVMDVVEPLRQNKMTHISSLARSSFASGGFADIAAISVTQPIQVIQQAQQFTTEEIASAMKDAVKSLPPGVVIVEDINTGQARVASVQDRANIF